MSANDDYSGISVPVGSSVKDDYSGISTPVDSPAHAYDNSVESAAPLHGLAVSALNVAKNFGKGVLNFGQGLAAGAGSALAMTPAPQAFPKSWQLPGAETIQPNLQPQQQEASQTIANMAPKTGAGHVGLITGQILTPTTPLDIAGLGETLKAFKLGAATIKDIPKIIGRGVAQAAEEQTAMPANVLKMAGTPTGLAQLQAVKGKAYQIGQSLVDNIYNPWDKIPEAQNIKEIAQKIPSVSSTALQKTLTSHIIENPVAELKPVNDKIIQKMNEIGSIAKQNSNGELTAPDLINIRQQLDKVIDNGFGQEANSYITALKDTRHTIKDMLLQSANESGIPEYADQMKSFANKLDLVDKLKSKLGANVKQGEDHAEGFISNLFGKNRTNTQETLKDFDQAFGTDYYNQANAAHLADYLNPEGKLPIFTKWPTGRSGMLGKMGAFTIGSPRVMSWALNNPVKASIAATIPAAAAAYSGINTIANMGGK
jgi:hypothetical protein